MEVDFVACKPMEQGLAELPEMCADLVICDPPYYRVKGEFDKAWPDFAAYLQDVERWRDVIARILKPNGTLMWWGFHTTIAHVQVRLEKAFRTLNVCVLRKANDIQNVFASPEATRRFLPNAERLLVMEPNGADKVAENPAVLARNAHRHAEGLCLSRCARPVIDYLNAEREAAGWSVKAINDALGTQMATHWFTRKSQFQLPTREWYEKLRALFNGEHLRREYEDLRRPWDTHGQRLTDIIEGKSSAPRYGHPTEKDHGVARLLVRTATRPGALVVAPFCGSGTECAAAKALGRHWIGFDTSPEYVEAARKRIELQPLELEL